MEHRKLSPYDVSWMYVARPWVTFGLIAMVAGCSGRIIGVTDPFDAGFSKPDGGTAQSCPDPTPAASCIPIQAQIAAALAGHPTSTVTVQVPPCVNMEGETIPYRERVTLPGPTSTPPRTVPLVLAAAPGAEIRGSDVWTQWSPSDAGWISALSVPAFGNGGGGCLTSEGAGCGDSTSVDCHRCQWVEQLFVDGQARRHVASCADGTSDPACGGMPALDGYTFALDAQRHVLLSSASGFDPTRHCLEVSMRAHWIMSAQGASDVTIQGFTMKHAATGSNDGAVHNGPVANRVEGGTGTVGNDQSSEREPGWSVLDNDLSESHSAALSLSGAPDAGATLVARGNHFSDCGDLGMHSSNTYGLLVEGNTIERNGGTDIDGVLDPGFSQGWQSGGFKAAHQTHMTVQGNTVRDNVGAGLWCDVDCYDTTYSGNTVTGNQGAGIFYEISDSAQILSNTVQDNGSRTICCGDGCPATSGCDFFGAPQIGVSASRHVEVAGNTVSGGLGIGVLAQFRDDACICPDYDADCCLEGVCSGTSVYHVVQDVQIHDNDITQPNSQTSAAKGLVAGLAEDIYNPTTLICTQTTDASGATCSNYFADSGAQGADIVFAGNTYHFPNATCAAASWKLTSAMSWSQWQASGQDVDGKCLEGP